MQSVSVKPIRDERADCNWSIAIDDLGSADGYLARRIALNVHERLSAHYDLAIAVPDGTTTAVEVLKTATPPRGSVDTSSESGGTMQ